MTGEVLELRVHGVSNTPPGDLLGGVARPRRVAGDEITGFYRRPGVPPVEAYSWGQLTSGVRAKKDIQRALWTLLLPFTLANLAVHARADVSPGGESRRRPGAWLSAYLVRLFCLSLTVTLVVAATGVGVDLVAWQCVDQACLDRIPGSWGFLGEGFWRGAGRAAVVGLAVPALLLAVVGLVARRSYHYEAELPDDPAELPDDLPELPDHPVEKHGDLVEERDQTELTNPLRDRDFWRGEVQVRRLFAIHLGTGMAVAAAIPLAAVAPLDRPQGAGQAVLVALTVGLLAAALLLSVVGLGHPSVTRRGHQPGLAPVWRSQPRYAFWAGGAGFGATTVYLLWTGDKILAGDRPPPGCASNYREGACAGRTLPFYDGVITWLGLTQLLVLAALAVLALVGYLRRERGPGSDRLSGPAWFGMGPAVLAGLGWALGVMYATGILYWATDRLNQDATPTGRSAITPPIPLLWTAVALVIVLVVLLVVGFALLLRLAWLKRRSVDRIFCHPHFRREGQQRSSHAQRRARTVAGWYGLHQVVERNALTAMGWIALVVAVLAAGGVGLSVAGILSVVEVWPLTEPGNAWAYLLKWSADLGGRLAGVVPWGIAAVALLTYRSPGIRRGIGVVWDIVAFWPRSAHPLAPPSYAEAAVPQLQTRVAQLLVLPAGSPGAVRGVILSGHSQGALLCLATILALPPRLLRRAWLVTHGCQLNRLYGRVFPAYAGPSQLAAISGWLRQGAPNRWTNFWRETDPLGYRVRAGNRAIAMHDRRLPDPEALRPAGGEVLAPPVRNHSDYPLDARYRQECRRIRRALARVGGEVAEGH